MILVICKIPAVIVGDVLIGLISEDPVGHHTAILRPLIRKARKEGFQPLSVAVLGVEGKYNALARPGTAHGGRKNIVGQRPVAQVEYACHNDTGTVIVLNKILVAGDRRAEIVCLTLIFIGI